MTNVDLTERRWSVFTANTQSMLAQYFCTGTVLLPALNNIIVHFLLLALLYIYFIALQEFSLCWGIKTVILRFVI